MTIALVIWFSIVSFLGGAHLATGGKIKVNTVKAEAPKVSFLRPCIGAGDVKCDKK